jgi:hypothetical protein
MADKNSPKKKAQPDIDLEKAFQVLQVSEKQFDRACANLEKGVKVEESIPIVYGIKPGSRQFAELVKIHQQGTERKKLKGQAAVDPALRKLKHDGESGYTGKVWTLLHPKKAEITVETNTWPPHDDALKAWKAFAGRQKALFRKLESALAKYYRQFRPRCAFPENMPTLKRNADVWSTLGDGPPEIAIEKEDDRWRIVLYWQPLWDDEHGLYVYLDASARIQHVGHYQ